MTKMAAVNVLVFGLIMAIDCSFGGNPDVDQKFERLERLLLEKDRRIDQLETAFKNYVASHDDELASTNLALAEVELNVKRKEHIIQELRDRVVELETKVSRETKTYSNDDIILPVYGRDPHSKSMVDNGSEDNMTVIKSHDATKEMLPSKTFKQDEIRSVSRPNLGQIRVGDVDPSTNIVFHAEMTGTNGAYKTGNILIFDHEILDEGNGYNPLHGLYLVPVSGVYIFSWTTTTNHAYIQTVLNVNGVTRGSSFTDSRGVSEYRQSTMIVPLFLYKGDTVSIRVGTLGNGVIYTTAQTSRSTFSGWKLAEL